MPEVDLSRRLQDVRARVTRERASAEEPAPTPMFAGLARKDVRLRDDQVIALAALVPVLMARRRVKTERITANTLIRVAVDLLLAHRDELHGSSETELRNSVCPTLLDSRSPELADSATAEGTDFRTRASGTATVAR